MLHEDLQMIEVTFKGKHRIVSLLPKQVLIFMLPDLVAPNLNLVQVK